MRTAKVRALDGRWRSWAPSWLASHRPSRLALPQRDRASRAVAHRAQAISRDDLKKRIATAALAFRGYDPTNLGRSPELLEHPRLRADRPGHLDAASVLCGDVLGKKVDLAARVLAREPSTLETFVQDIGTIVAMELAQVRLLEEILRRPRSTRRG